MPIKMKITHNQPQAMADLEIKSITIYPEQNKVVTQTEVKTHLPGVMDNQGNSILTTIPLQTREYSLGDNTAVLQNIASFIVNVLAQDQRFSFTDVQVTGYTAPN